MHADLELLFLFSTEKWTMFNANVYNMTAIILQPIY